MSEKLLGERADLEMAYAKANDALAEAQAALKDAKQEVLDFDEEHPEVMLAVKTIANDRKAAAGAAKRKEAEEAEGGDE